jgi:alpha-beta hydrolase superfamily lysophospholipase
MDTPVMMVHGMCCTGDVWQRFREFFEARGTRVYTPTLRPLARCTVSERPSRALSEIGFTEYIADLEDEIARIERETGKTPVVIGHSMGGLLAQMLAERNSVRAAVFISPSAPLGVGTLQWKLSWALIMAAAKFNLVPYAISPDRRAAERAALHLLSPEDRQAAHAAMVHESGRAFTDIGRCRIDETKIRIPVLTVAASRDRLVPAVLVRLTGKKYATIGGEFREYGAHAHWLYAEPGWEKPAEEIYEWLRSKTQDVQAGAA